MSAPRTLPVSTATLSTPARGAQVSTPQMSAPAVSTPVVSTVSAPRVVVLDECQYPEIAAAVNATVFAAITAERDAAQRLALLRADYSELWAHARATVAAVRDGDPAPYALLTGWLAERGALPADGQHASELLGHAYPAEVTR